MIKILRMAESEFLSDCIFIGSVILAEEVGEFLSRKVYETSYKSF